MHDDPPLLRQWKLMSLLSARKYGLTIRDMAREMNVGQKTIRRDLDLFRQVGLPLEPTRGERGCKTWRIPGERGYPALTLTYDEAAALYLGRQLLEPLAGTPFWSAAHGAWRKIRAMLGETASGYIDRFAKMFHCTTFGQVDYSGKAQVLDDLTEAIEDHKVVHLTYRSQQATEQATRDVYPLGWVRHRDALYLIAGGPDHGRPRTYKLDRIEALEVSAFVHQCYRDFDP
jgi:predicted DNA-binding transcriptional regulator YafY